MCTQFHANSFIGRIISELKRIIKHNPEKVGELEFNAYLPPKLCHLDEASQRNAEINNAIGTTFGFLTARYGKVFVKKRDVKKLFESLFDKKITATRYAFLLIKMAQAVSSQIYVKEKRAVLNIGKPSEEDFGSKKIYFKLLNMVFELSISNLMHNRDYEENFEVREKNLQNFMESTSELIADKNAVN
jgi:hypothetical protein